MTIGAAVQAEVVGARASQLVSAPVSLSSQWVPCIDAGGVSTHDNGGNPIDNIVTQVDSATTHPVSFTKGGGTQLMARLKYPATFTVTNQLRVSAHGRTGGQDFQELRNVQGNKVVEITVDPANDMKSADGAWRYSFCNPAIHAWDRLGCDDIVLAVEQALSASVGSAAAAVLEGKAI